MIKNLTIIIIIYTLFQILLFDGLFDSSYKELFYIGVNLKLSIRESPDLVIERLRLTPI